ncbi:MAG: hypothetical protein U0840_01910 [Gemmataceae bacterium]
MGKRELARALRHAHRDQYGEVSPRPDPEEAEGAIAEAEEELGFTLPKLIRAVFTLAGPDFVNLEFGVSKYCERYGADKAPDAPGYWPARMLPIKDLQGEVDWLCVDCTAGAGPVYVFYDNWDSGEPCWPGLFEPVSASLEDFLYGFAEGGVFPPGRTDVEDPDGRA